MNINWKVRLQSKAFVTTIIAFIIFLAGKILPSFGVTIDIGILGEALNYVLIILMGLGIVNDPTVKSFSDSATTLAKTDINQTANDVIDK